MELTAGIVCKVGPAVIQEDLLKSNLNSLHLTHLSWGRPKLFQVSHELHKAGHKGKGQVLSEALMRTIAESINDDIGASWQKFVCVFETADRRSARLSLETYR
jgi:hypothetical protein